MKRIISLALIMVTIISIISIPAQASGNEELITIKSACIEYELSEKALGFPFYIKDPKNSSKKPRINEEILSKDGYLVYGSHKDVPQNDQKEGEWRYVGYSLEGIKFSNFHFPWEGRVEGRLDTDRKWIKNPWETIGNTNKLLESDQSEYNQWHREQTAKWIEEIMGSEESGWQDPGVTGKMVHTGFPETNTTSWTKSTESWTGTELVDYFNVQSPPSDYTAGSLIGWHTSRAILQGLI